MGELSPDSYRKAVRRYINPHLGPKRLGELSALDVKRSHGVLLTSGRQDGRPLATNSVKLAQRVLHRADAVRWNLIFVNPVSSVRVDRITGLDLSDVSIDGSLHKVPCGGEGTFENMCDRAKLGWK